MTGTGRKGTLVATAALVVIVGAGAWIATRLFYEPPPPPPLDHQWACDKCGHLFRQPLPQVGAQVEGEQISLVELLGGAVKCPKCGEAAHCRPLLRCRTCGASFAATIAVGQAGTPIPFQCIHPGCKRPLLAASTLSAEAEAKGRELKCESCGRTFLLVETPKAQGDGLLCPYTDHDAATVRAVE